MQCQNLERKGFLSIMAEHKQHISFLRIISKDTEYLLRCPACHAEALHINGNDGVACGTCGADYPVDGEKLLCSLMSDVSDTATKTDIQKWWGDLYHQLYAGHEDELSAQTLKEQLAKLEDLFVQRRHMATIEMPLKDIAGKRVLEIGPGGGGHSSLFALHGASVVAVDITPQRVMATNRKLFLLEGNGRAYQADGENLPFRDNSVDIVYSNGVLHHSENTDKCIEEVFRILKPGGKAIIMLYSRHSTTYWLNILPRAIITGEIFHWPEAQWIGRLTEGKPKFADTKNPITRVYSEKQMRYSFRHFTIHSLRKSSFQFDNFCVPKLSQIRFSLLKMMGRRAHSGGVLVYGAPYMTETAMELWLGRFIGFSWNIVAEKDE